MTDQKSTDSDKNAGKKPSSLGVLFKQIFTIILLDLAVFGPLREFAKRKGPLVVVRVEGRRGKRRKAAVAAEREAMKKKLFGWTVGAIIGIGAIAVVAVTAYNWASKKWAERAVAPAA